MEAAATGFPEGVLLLLKNKAVVKKINHRDPQGMSSEFINRHCTKLDHDFGTSFIQKVLYMFDIF